MEKAVNEVLVVKEEQTMDFLWECWIFTMTEQQHLGIWTIILTIIINL